MTLPWDNPDFLGKPQNHPSASPRPPRLRHFFVRSDENGPDRDRGAAQTFLCLRHAARAGAQAVGWRPEVMHFVCHCLLVKQCFFLTHELVGRHSMDGNHVRLSSATRLASSVVDFTAGQASSGTHHAQHSLR